MGGIFYALFGLQENAGGSEIFRNRTYFSKKQHCNGVYIKPPGYCILYTFLRPSAIYAHIGQICKLRRS